MLTTTSTELLAGLREPQDERVWSEFHGRYWPLIVAFAKRLGLTEPDALDAAQETLLAFVAAYREGKYERGRGKLRSWLFGIAQRKVRDIQRRRGKELVITVHSGENGLMNQVVDERSMSEVWEAEWRRAMVKACLNAVRRQVEPTTMEAFELITLKGKSTSEAADELEMTHNAVLKANRRVLSRMREMQGYLQANW